MNRNHEIALLAELAERRGCYFHGNTPALQRALRRRVAAGTLVSPYRNLYARTSYWESLNPRQRLMHLILSLAMRYPHWTFAATSAAIVHELELPWTCIGNLHVTIADTFCGTAKRRNGTRRIFMRGVPKQRRTIPPLQFTADQRTKYGRYDSTQALRRRLAQSVTICATTAARTLVDCGMRLDFAPALAIADSALRKCLTHADEVDVCCDRLRHGRDQVRHLMQCANPLSENGGESLCRAGIITAGYAPPQLQREFVDPRDPLNKARADFVWNAPDGRIIVLEYDGMRKYVDPAMTKRRDIADVVAAQLKRDTMLRHAGVDSIIHVTYDEAVNLHALRSKLAQAGVPRQDCCSPHATGNTAD